MQETERDVSSRPSVARGLRVALGSERGRRSGLADRFREHPEALPSELVPEDDAAVMGPWVTDQSRARGIDRWGLRVHRGGE